MSRVKPLHVVIVDDENYRTTLSEKLQNAQFRCTPLEPPASPVPEEIISKKPDAILVDYQLTTKPKGTSRPPVAYMGSLLVAALRERLPTTPILLLTRSSLAKVQGDDFFAGAADLDDAFDELLYKEAVNADIPRVRTVIRSLSDGYRVLGKDLVTRDSLVKALETPQYAHDELRRFGGPSAGPSPTGKADAFRPTAVAKWVRHTLLRFPGLLVNDLQAATEIGVDINSFSNPAIRRWFSECRYEGIFSSEALHWWRGALRARAESLKTTMSNDSDMTPFVAAWNARHTASQIKPALCCVCGKPTRDAVCELLNRPVMLRCSLPFYPDSRPPGFDVARISFKAIQTKNLDDSMFASNVLDIVREVEAGK